MSYTNPPTFAADDPLAADELNVLSDDIRFLKAVADGVTASGAQVYRTSSQSIPNGTDTLVTFQAEQFDFGGYWGSGTNVVIPAGAIPAGFTKILVQTVSTIRFATNGTGIRRLRPLLNGTFFGSSTLGGISGDPTEIVHVDFVEVEAGDVITLQVKQTSGGSLNLEAAAITVMRHAPSS